MTSSPNTTILQEHCGEKQQRNTKVRRMNVNTQIKVTTPITVALHEQCHQDCSDNKHSQANAKIILLPYKSITEKSNNATPK